MNTTHSLTPIPLPDYEVNNWKHRFTGKTGKYGVRTSYNVERSVDGGPWAYVGKVTKVRDSSFSSNAYWTAESMTGHKSSGTTREAAAYELERVMQGPEYQERKHAEYMARMDAQRLLDEQREAKDAENRAELGRRLSKLDVKVINGLSPHEVESLLEALS